MNPFLLLTLGVAVSMVIVPFAIRLAPTLGMVDLPDPRKVHSKPIPRVGGWGIVIGSLVPLVILQQFTPLVQSFVIGGLTLFLYGLWDDARQISHSIKFVGQFFAAGLVVYYGGLYVTHFPFMLEQTLDPAIGKPFTVVAIVGMINAINHSDGLDGLAGGESILSLIVIAILGYMADDSFSVALAFATMGGILGFLRYNTHPALVFMGDSGSQFLGFALAFLAVYLTQVAHPALCSALPLLFLGLPIADIIVVLFLRIKGKMNWFKATRNHIHHRLLALGFDHYETVVIIYSVQLILVLCAIFMRYQSDFVVIATYLGVVGALFAGLSIGERMDLRAHESRVATGLSRLVASLKLDPRFADGLLLTISVLVPALVLGGAAWVAQVPRDFALVAGVLALLLAMEILLNRVQGSIVVRATVYVAAVFSAYLAIHHPGSAAYPFTTLALLAIGMLAISTATFVRITSEGTFGTTPTDYLIVFGVLAIAFFGNTYIAARDTAQLVVFSVVLIYASEVLISRGRSRWHILNLGTLATLLVMAVRGLL